MGGHPQHVCSRVGGRGRHRALRCHGVAVRARRRVRAVPDLPQRTLALRTAPRSHRSRLPAHVRRPDARSKDAAVTQHDRQMTWCLPVHHTRGNHEETNCGPWRATTPYAQLPESAGVRMTDPYRFNASSRRTTRGLLRARAVRATRRAQDQPLDVVRLSADRRAGAQRDRPTYAIASLAGGEGISRPPDPRAAASRVRRARSSRSPDERGDPGQIDAMKLRSSMTLFVRAAPGEPLFREALDRFFDGSRTRRPSGAFDAARG